MLCSLIKRSLLSDLLFVMLHEITLLISFSCLASCLYFVSAPQLFEVMVLPGHTHGVREELHPRLIYLLRDIDADPSSSWTLVCAPSREERFDGLQLRVDRDLRVAVGHDGELSRQLSRHLAVIVAMDEPPVELAEE